MNKTTAIVRKGIDSPRVEKLSKRFVSVKDTTTKKLKGAASVVFKNVSALAKAISNKAYAGLNIIINFAKKGETSSTSSDELSLSQFPGGRTSLAMLMMMLTPA